MASFNRRVSAGFSKLGWATDECWWGDAVVRKSFPHLGEEQRREAFGMVSQHAHAPGSADRGDAEKSTATRRGRDHFS